MSTPFIPRLRWPHSALHAYAQHLGLDAMVLHNEGQLALPVGGAYTLHIGPLGDQGYALVATLCHLGDALQPRTLPTVQARAARDALCQLMQTAASVLTRYASTLGLRDSSSALVLQRVVLSRGDLADVLQLEREVEQFEAALRFWSHQVGRYSVLQGGGHGY
jgi:hypothetical protein